MLHLVFFITKTLFFFYKNSLFFTKTAFILPKTADPTGDIKTATFSLAEHQLLQQLRQWSSIVLTEDTFMRSLTTEIGAMKKKGQSTELKFSFCVLRVMRRNSVALLVLYFQRASQTERSVVFQELQQWLRTAAPQNLGEGLALRKEPCNLSYQHIMAGLCRGEPLLALSQEPYHIIGTTITNMLVAYPKIPSNILNFYSQQPPMPLQVFSYLMETRWTWVLNDEHALPYTCFESLINLLISSRLRDGFYLTSNKNGIINTTLFFGTTQKKKR